MTRQRPTAQEWEQLRMGTKGISKPMMLRDDDAVHVGGGDGRPTVGMGFDDDPLLSRLKRVHGAPRYDHFMNPVKGVVVTKGDDDASV